MESGSSCVAVAWYVMIIYMPRGATKESWEKRRANGNGHAWNKGKALPQITGKNNSRYNRFEKCCAVCNKTFIVKGYRKDTAKYCSHICEKIGKRNPNPTYNAIHKWVNFQLGSPKECTECGFSSENSRQFHWANISKEYKRDTTDWVRLCVRCHHNWDKRGIVPRCTAVA